MRVYLSSAFSVHLPDELVDILLPVTEITTFDEMLELPLPESARGVAKLEWPEEVACLFEVRANGIDFVDQILHAHDTVLSEVLFDDGVICKGDALLRLGLRVTTLVDEFAHRLEVGVAVSDERLDDLQHLRCGLGQTDEDAIVDLQQSEKLESLSLFRVDLVDTLNAHHEDKLGFGRHVVGALLLGNTRETGLLTLGVAVLLDVCLGSLEDLLSFLLGGLQTISTNLAKCCLSLYSEGVSCSVPKDG